MEREGAMMWCEKCGEYKRKQTCSCKTFRVVHPSNDPEYVNGIYAVDAKQAAERYAQSYNEESGDYCMMQGDDTIEILVNDVPYKVTAEAVIEYYVEKVK